MLGAAVGAALLAPGNLKGGNVSKSNTGHRCESCGDFVRKGTLNIQVGRKATGQARLIHDRSRCRQKWSREKARIMASWPEVRDAAHSLDPAREVDEAILTSRNAVLKSLVAGSGGRPEPPQATKATLPPAAEFRRGETVTFGPAIPAEPEKGAGMEATLNGPEVKRPTRHTWKFKPELVSVIRTHLSKKGWRAGEAGRLHAVLEATQPGLLVDMTGARITEPVLSRQVSKLLFEHQAAVGPVMHGAQAPVVPDLAKAVGLGEVLVNGVLALVKANDTATLETLVDLMKGGGK